MTGSLVRLFTELGDFWLVFFLSMLPVTELRAAIPLGIARGLPFWEAYLAGFLGNVLPAPFILILLKPVVQFFSRWEFMEHLFERLFARTTARRQQVERFGLWGLLLFVALPVPGTGVWTGSLLAFIFRLPFWRSLAAIAGGAAVAGVLVSLASLGLLELAGISSWGAVMTLVLVIVLIWWIASRSRE